MEVINEGSEDYVRVFGVKVSKKGIRLRNSLQKTYVFNISVVIILLTHHWLTYRYEDCKDSIGRTSLVRVGPSYEIRQGLKVSI